MKNQFSEIIHTDGILQDIATNKNKFGKSYFFFMYVTMYIKVT